MNKYLVISSWHLNWFELVVIKLIENIVALLNSVSIDSCNFGSKLVAKINYFAAIIIKLKIITNFTIDLIPWDSKQNISLL